MDRHLLAALVAEPVPFLTDSDPHVRRVAVSACSASITDAEVVAALTSVVQTEPDPRVKAEAVEVLAEAGPGVRQTLLSLTQAKPTPQDEHIVLEATATALGEIESSEAVPWLIETAHRHENKLVREAAVAALGAVGDDRAVPVLLDLLTKAPPQIRRRCVVALAAFEGIEVEAAISLARDDRNPMVREVAEMVVGRPLGT